MRKSSQTSAKYCVFSDRNCFSTPAPCEAPVSTTKPPTTGHNRDTDMGHLIIFVSILILTIGCTVVYQGIQIYRAYRFPAIRSFVLFIAIYNLVGLMTLIAQYLIRNVGPITSDGMYILVIVIMGSIGFTLAAFEVALFASTVWYLAGMTRAPRWFVYGYGFVCTAGLAAFLLGVYRFFHVADRRFLLDVHAGITLILFALDFLLPLFLLVKARHIEPDRQRRMAQCSSGSSFFPFPVWRLAHCSFHPNGSF